MNAQEFQKLIGPYMDGELAADERAAVDAYLEQSEAAREQLSFELALRDKTAQALRTEMSDLEQQRILLGFRNALAHADKGGAKVSGLSMQRRWTLVASACAAALVLAYFWPPFETVPTNPVVVDIHANQDAAHRGHNAIISQVLNIDRDFDRRIRDCQKNPNLGKRAYVEALKTEKDSRIFEDDCGKATADRLAECKEMFMACVDRNVKLPKLPDDAVLHGVRVKALTLDKQTLMVPHMVISLPSEHLSVYILCGSTANALEKSLRCYSAEAKSKVKSGLFGCEACGVVTRRYGEILLMLISNMDFKAMRGIAVEF